jgi:tetratricopeptide (TPR) repeat protein
LKSTIEDESVRSLHLRQRHFAWNTAAAFVFGVVFFAVLATIAIFIPNPSEFQVLVFRVILATSGAGIGGAMPGLVIATIGPYFRGGGAMALFLIVYAVNPPAIITDFAPYDESLRRAQSQLEMKGYNSALTFFEKARQARPNSWEPPYGIGRVYYEEGNYAAAADSLEEAFNLTKKKDGTLVYGIMMAHEGLGQYDAALRDLGVAETLMARDTPLYADLVFDRGLLNLILWVREDAPKETTRYENSEQAFDDFLERGYKPEQWAHYNLACLKATRAQDNTLQPREIEMLRSRANQELEQSVKQLIENSSSAKAPIQRQLMKQLLQSPERAFGKPGEPIPCPAMITSWKSEKRSISDLIVSLD